MDMLIAKADSESALDRVNLLCPFQRSGSFWTLTALLSAVILSAYRHLDTFRSAGHLFDLAFYLISGAALYSFYILFRIHISRVASEPIHTETSLKGLTSASSATTILCQIGMVALLLIFLI
jgi:hypothetical protein